MVSISCTERQVAPVGMPASRAIGTNEAPIRKGRIADPWIPKAYIVHSYPHQRFAAKYSR